MAYNGNEAHKVGQPIASPALLFGNIRHLVRLELANKLPAHTSDCVWELVQ